MQPDSPLRDARLTPERGSVHGVKTSNETTWPCDGQRLRIAMDRSGDGPTIVMLPALSSISTRREMWPLRERLDSSFSTITVDWPGFGDQAKPFLDWRPEIYESFLEHLFDHVVSGVFATVAAGHAAGYLLKYCAKRPGSGGRLVLLSPTWRGPLPTMAGSTRPLFRRIARMFDRAVTGPALYALNVNRLTIGMMARGHVYSDRTWLRDARLLEKRAVTRAVGARHASARFVTGCLDPFTSRLEFIRAAQAIAGPVLNVFSDNAPSKSKQEMQALAELSNVITVRASRGKLSFYEEYPDDAALAIGQYLTRQD